MIHSIEEVANLYETTKDGLHKAVFKHTDCGAWIDWDDVAVRVGSIVEGSEAEVGPYSLKFPFTEEEYWAALSRVESEVDDIWTGMFREELRCGLIPISAAATGAVADTIGSLIKAGLIHDRSACYMGWGDPHWDHIGHGAKPYLIAYFTDEASEKVDKAFGEGRVSEAIRQLADINASVRLSCAEGDHYLVIPMDSLEGDIQEQIKEIGAL